MAVRHITSHLKKGFRFLLATEAKFAPMLQKPGGKKMEKNQG
jgi:hypothetical protein